MIPSRTFMVGRLRCHCLNGGLQRLDGGAMFGVVPKPLWERRVPPDHRNRIPLALRCLLIEHDDGLVLVDTAVGNKENEKFIDIYGVENAGETGSTLLDDAIAEKGFTAAEVKYVINTHLHFDHAGGNTMVPTSELLGRPAAQPPVLAFPNATYLVQKGELDFARRRNERIQASYLPPNFEPVDRAGRWRLLEGAAQVLPGISVLPTPGHVPFHQSVVIQSGGETACFVGDLIPMVAHLPLPWIMGYDLEPMVTLESKRWFLERAAAQGWMLVFQHEPGDAVGTVRKDEKGYVFLPA
jgi:glyoxylase-like metal-dependent hydrolase (beta-lactamase superfamily II)